MEVIILRGIPGSGKSTLAKKLWPKAVVVSADSFFTDAEGKYNFDPSKLSEAHNQCLMEFISEVTYLRELKNSGTPYIPEDFTCVVDNTNCSLVEIAPYVAIANAFGIPVRVLSLQVPIGQAVERNVHGVPKETILKMEETFTKTNQSFPAWWTHGFFIDKEM